MRILIELFALFFALLTIYRRLIKPFLEGIAGKNKTNNQSGYRQNTKFNTTPPKKNIKTVDPNEIQDAEFEEIK